MMQVKKKKKMMTSVKEYVNELKSCNINKGSTVNQPD